MRRGIHVKNLAFKRLAILAAGCVSGVLVLAQPSISAQNIQNGVGTQDSRPFSTPDAGDADKRSSATTTKIPAAADSTYMIGPADILTIQVWHEPDLSAKELPVRPDGKISIPLLNDIQAAGLTPMQLTQEITKGLKRYVSDPQVTVVVDAINSKRIYVMGQVQRPGAYPLLPQMSVLQALSGAGGFLQYANPKKTYVLRGSTKLPFNYKDALQGKHLEQQPILQPGDTVVVP